MTASASGGAINGSQYDVGGNTCDSATVGAAFNIVFSMDIKWVSSSFVAGGHGVSVAFHGMNEAPIAGLAGGRERFPWLVIGSGLVPT